MLQKNSEKRILSFLFLLLPIEEPPHTPVPRHVEEFSLPPGVVGALCKVEVLAVAEVPLEDVGQSPAEPTRPNAGLLLEDLLVLLPLVRRLGVNSKAF